MTNRYKYLPSILQYYDQTLLTETFRTRIRNREIAKLFPFSLHNIYRVLIAISEEYFLGFKHLLDANLALDVLIENMGTPSRVFRYFHVIIYGSQYAKNCSEDEIMGALEQLSQVVLHIFDEQLRIPNEDRETFESSTEIAQDFKLLIRLAIYLREFADLVNLGQHDQSFLSYPPEEIDHGLLVLRKFFNLPTIYVQWKQIKVFTLYKDPETPPQFDRFRGDIELLPSPQYLSRGIAMADEQILTDVEISQCIQRLSAAIETEKQKQAMMKIVETEIHLADLFCAELFHLLELAGEDIHIWREKIKQNIITAHNKPHQYGFESNNICFTDVYINRLRDISGKLYVGGYDA